MWVGRHLEVSTISVEVLQWSGHSDARLLAVPMLCCSLMVVASRRNAAYSPIICRRLAKDSLMMPMAPVALGKARSPFQKALGPVVQGTAARLSASDATCVTYQGHTVQPTLNAVLPLLLSGRNQTHEGGFLPKNALPAVSLP